jgi:hypothetical protein
MGYRCMASRDMSGLECAHVAAITHALVQPALFNSACLYTLHSRCAAIISLCRST